MYRNWLTGMIMSTDWSLIWIWPSIFKFYDMFTIQGWMDWFWDYLSLLSGFWTIQVSVRLFSDDWYWLAPENDNDIDMNRLFQSE